MRAGTLFLQEKGPRLPLKVLKNRIESLQNERKREKIEENESFAIAKLKK